MLYDVTVIVVTFVLGLMALLSHMIVLAWLSWFITYVGIVWMILVWRHK